MTELLEGLKNIIISAVSIVILGLASYGLALLKNWINTKISDKKAANFLCKVTDIITNAVKQVYQEFVEVLKKEGKFDDDKQKEAKDKALNIIRNQFTPELTEYVKSNFGDIEEYASRQIEAVIYNLKNLGKNKDKESK